MVWLVGIGALAVGMVIGVLIAGRLNASPSRIRQLENEIRQLKEAINDLKQ